MDKLHLIVLASSLNKQGELREAHKSLFQVLDAHYDVRLTTTDMLQELPAQGFRLVFVSSGGVENTFRQHYHQLPQPTVLLTDGLQNSLAASLEISTWVRQQGAPCHIIHGEGERLAQSLAEECQLQRQRQLLSGRRIGVIGEPSAWLIASGVDAATARERWGVELVDVSLDEVEQAFRAIADTQATEGAEAFLSHATAVREPSVDETVKAYRLYLALKQLCRDHRLDAFTIQCFGLIPRLATTGCLALSLLNDEGIVAGCEGDMQTLITMLICQQIAGCPGFMCNPSHVDVERNEILLAHCTIGLRQTERYVVRSHFESLSGVAIQGHLAEDVYTLVKCGGRDARQYFVSTARLLENTLSENVCRTQVRLHLDEPVGYFFSRPIANHHVLLRGDHADALRRYFEANGLRSV